MAGPGFFFCILALLAACSTGSVLTAKIHENKEWIVRLQSVSGANGNKGYAHPSSVTQQQLVRVLEGLYIESDYFPVSVSENNAPNSANRHLVFSNVDAELLAIFLADGLSQASAQEIVTFVKTTRISSRQEQITSGGIYVAGDEFHIVLSNYRVKQAIWQDLDSYDAPVHLRPMTPLSTQPGHFGFARPNLVRDVPPSESEFKGKWSGVSWHLAVRFETF